MFVVDELIRAENDGSLSFGNHMASSKQKVRDFKVKGDVYNLKTFNEITKLEKNENLLFEAFPGVSVQNFVLSEAEITFTMYGSENTQITLELEPSVEYGVEIAGEPLGNVKTTMSGKLVFSAEMSEGPVSVAITKV